MGITLSENISKNAKRDIRELESKIDAFKNGQMDEEKFRAFRLTRGVYGQRQIGVQMIRIKIPFGKVTPDQLDVIANASDKYTNGRLHATTRQNIQMHHVKVDDSPALWNDLEKEDVTLREACGNTVRTVTASPIAGVDPQEAFDVSPYAHEYTQYFLRNPICQDMGRKFKTAFSSNETDSAYTYIHDLGFTPKVKTVDGQEVRGFEVVIGGGLGAQAFSAIHLYDFLEEDQVIPLAEAVIRVFDRYGEREKRGKARLKFLVDEKRGIGLKAFMELVETERIAIKNKSYKINRNILPEPQLSSASLPTIEVSNEEKYKNWLRTNTFEQKQKGYYGAFVKLQLGNLSSDTARKFSEIVRKYAAPDIRVTIQQGFFIRFVSKDALPHLFNALDELGLAEYGHDTIADITACPGTDTCNLAVANSTDIAVVIEDMIRKEYHDLIDEADIKIKISGCMNACGQHMIANIGLHGSSIKKGTMVIPAQQIVIGGGINPNGEGFIAEKVIKVPSKKILDAFRALFDDYINNAKEGEYYNDYFQRQEKMYFYQLLKPVSSIDSLEDNDFIDWGDDKPFIPEIGVGECAGAIFDIVDTIIADSDVQLSMSDEAIESEVYADAIYHAYNSLVIGAKGLLLSEDQKCNTQIGIFNDFDTYFVESGKIAIEGKFKDLILNINKSEPSKEFASSYIKAAKDFSQKVKDYRGAQKSADSDQRDKVVVDSFYKA